TVGHSITLMLATLDLIRVSDPLVEVLIPLTIAATCAVNLFYKEGKLDRDPGAEASQAGHTREARIRYGLAMGFGLIHGLGFSNFLRAALGGEENILVPLFAFNVGLEVGQLAIVAVLSLVALTLIERFGLTRRLWVVGVSVIAGAVAALLVIQRL
ncbi:MAG: HupE/UreJ family protein, partial [marine benthic group bacterium]|nr:HupE/UreJ family protein [Gemmatimonadota bacterium]